MKKRKLYSQTGSKTLEYPKTVISRIHNKKEMKVCAQIKEIGGRDGPEPTRFGDWEKSGRCIDF